MRYAEVARRGARTGVVVLAVLLGACTTPVNHGFTGSLANGDASDAAGTQADSALERGGDDAVDPAPDLGRDTLHDSAARDTTEEQYDSPTDLPPEAASDPSIGLDLTEAGGEPGLPAADPWEPHRIACVDRINGFRATLGLTPLERWTEAEPCTDDQSADDAADGVYHAHFGACGEWAQNTCPNWGSPESVVQSCLQMMWDEGPGEDFSQHGHYLNMSNSGYSRVACGFATTASGGVWHNHNFQ